MRRIWCVCLCLCLTSCGGKDYPHQTYPVAGQVLVNGKPAEGVEVTFRSFGDMGAEPYAPQGVTDREGRFTLTTYVQEDGAPAGSYQVGLTWPTYRRKTGNGPDRLGGKFEKPQGSGLTAQVDAGPNTLPPTEVKVDQTIINAADTKSKKEMELKTKKRKDRY